MKLSELKKDDVFRFQDEGRVTIGLVTAIDSIHLRWVDKIGEFYSLFFGGPSDNLEVEYLGKGRYVPTILEFPPEAYK